MDQGPGPTSTTTPLPPTDERMKVDLDLDDEPLWQWVGAATGIAFVVAILASAFIAPQPPHNDAAPTKILAYYVDHRRALLFSNWLGGLGVAFFLWFVGSLRGALGRALDSAAEFTVFPDEHSRGWFRFEGDWSLVAAKRPARTA